MLKRKKILIASLDWGLGHAVRDIPLIHDLIRTGYDIIIAGSGASLELLKTEFSSTDYYKLPSTSIKYTEKKSFFLLKMFVQIPKFIVNINKEKKQLKRIITKENIDLIISDNRYGVYAENIPSIFISHQIFLKLPKKYRIFERLINRVQEKHIRKFDKCLIPDFGGENNLSGELSHKYKLPKFYNYIGILSRFMETDQIYKKKYDIIVIISGPEPQRTIFYNKIYQQIKELGKTTMIVSGQPDNVNAFKDENIEVINHLSGKQLQKAILSSDIVITRAGYTSIMDLVSLKRKAILIPTPGQTEQLYLANYLQDMNLFVFDTQENLDLNQSIKKLADLKSKFSLFDNALKEPFLDIIKSAFHPNYLDSEKCITKN